MNEMIIAIALMCKADQAFTSQTQSKQQQCFCELYEKAELIHYHSHKMCKALNYIKEEKKK